MMWRSWFVFFVSLVLAAAARCATVPFLGNAAAISMRDAAVLVHLARGGAPAAEIRADVTCHFQMECREAREAATSFAMAFPIGHDEDPLAAVMSAATCVDFSVQVGQDRPEAMWRRWEALGPSGEMSHYFGYVWGT